MMSMLCNCCVRELLILARTWFAFGWPSKTGCDNRAPPRPPPSVAAVPARRSRRPLRHSRPRPAATELPAQLPAPSHPRRRGAAARLRPPPSHPAAISPTPGSARPRAARPGSARPRQHLAFVRTASLTPVDPARRRPLRSHRPAVDVPDPSHRFAPAATIRYRVYTFFIFYSMC
jgi:hypothetical protein